MNLNLSGSLNVFRLLSKPSLCLPHATISTFNELPIPLETALGSAGGGPSIKAVVLDKDDCFAYPETSTVHPPYKVKPCFLRDPVAVSLPMFLFRPVCFKRALRLQRTTSRS